MRLLTTTEPWQFIETEKVIPYAILSHMWIQPDAGQGSEVTYQELLAYIQGGDTRDTVAAKPGFDKIRQAIAVAARDGHSHIWLDTCCIDKTNILELDEAIRCMFKWYGSATICYAYLADVRPAMETTPQTSTNLKASRWFTRGWTLQELVAPQDVVFLASDWSLLGTRMGDRSFRRTLSEACGIDENVLDCKIAVSEIAVSARMKWAAHRTTTRVEDAAYSLMGIFGVHMPIMYGEGDAAFIRLQEEILKHSDDQSIFTWTAPGRDDDELCGLLADSPRRFADAINLRQLLPSNPELWVSDEFQITNKGLGLKLYLQPMNEDETGDIYAHLECYSHIAGTPLSPRLRLRRLWGYQFARVQTAEPLWHPYSRSIPGAMYQRLFVKQNPSFRLPELTIAREHIIDAQHDPTYRGYRLEQVFPATYWDGHSFFRASSPSLKHPAAVFRFSSLLYTDVVVDIAVGLRIEGPGRWATWHIQRRCLGEAIDWVYGHFGEQVLSEPSFPMSDEGKSHLRLLNANSLAWNMGDFVDSDVRIAASGEGANIGVFSFAIHVQLLPEVDSGPIADISANKITAIFPLPPETVSRDVYQDFVDDCVAILWPKATAWAPSSGFFPDEVPNSSVRIGPLDYPQLKAMIDDADIDEYEHVGQDLKFVQACKAGDSIGVFRILSEASKQKKLEQLLPIRSHSFHDFTGLHWAAAGGYADVVSHLLEFGADARAVTTKAWSACHLAVAMGHHAVVDILLRYDPSLAWHCLPDPCDASGPCSEDGYESIYHIAAALPCHYTSGALNSEAWLLSYFNDPHADSADGSPYKNDLHQNTDDSTTRSGDHPSMKNHLYETPLHRAAAAGNLGLVKFLLRIPRFMTSMQLLDRFDRSPLWHAAAGGHAYIVRLLAHERVNVINVNARDSYGISPLHIACAQGHEDVVRALLAYDADPNICTKALGFTPAHFAYYVKSGSCVEALKCGGADMTLRAGRSWFSVRPQDMETFAEQVFRAHREGIPLGHQKVNFFSTPLVASELE